MVTCELYGITACFKSFRKYVERALVIFEENLEKWQQGERDLVNLIDHGTWLLNGTI